jgi:HPt (histidine-containing phosphotransfer) domain-containing protein
MKSDEERCRAAGMDGYLTKPLDRDALRRELRRLTHASEWEAIAPSSLAAESSSLHSEVPVFNPSTTLSRGNGDREMIVEIADLYRSESARILQEMASALEQNDSRTASRLAHTLRGSSAFFDATQVVNLAAALEQAKEPDQMRATLPELQQAVATLCAALEEAYGGITQ